MFRGVKKVLFKWLDLLTFENQVGKDQRVSAKNVLQSQNKSRAKEKKKYHFCQLLMKRNEEDTSSKQKTSSIKTSLSLLTVIFYGSF